MRMTILVGLWSLSLAGCSHFSPFEIQHNHNISDPIEGSIDAKLDATPELEPLQEVVLEPGADCHSGCKVAVIDVDGLLLNMNLVGPYSGGENPVTLFKEKLRLAGRDPSVRAVVLRLNSPGGSVPATDLMAQSLAEFRAQTSKPVVACLLDTVTGGAYYLASGCDRIVAIPSSVIGGVGVVLNLYYLEIAMEQMNAFENSIKAGDLIDMGSPTRKMTKEEKAFLTEMAKEYHEQFKKSVTSGRAPNLVDADVFDGRVMSATGAKKAGLIDSVGYLADAIATAAQLANCGPAVTVLYRRPEVGVRDAYESVPNRPIQGTVIPWSVPGMDRSRLPLFFYLWNIEPTILRLAGV